MYRCQVPRAASPVTRSALLDHAASMLARRQPVTVRALATAAGTSTMAVYTHFGGMPGLWQAVRQEGFTRLDRHLAEVEQAGDPVRNLVALGRAYVRNALLHPDHYRVMFDTAADLVDPEAAAAAFELLVEGVRRAAEAGRFDRTTDAGALATRQWIIGHGATMLVLGGVLPAPAIDALVPPTLADLFVGAGDDRQRCLRSIAEGWEPVA